jgi:hypothetical protein
MTRLPEKVQKKIRQLSIEELRILFEGCVFNKKINKDRRAVLCKYIEKRLNKLLKQKDYNDTNIPDHEFINKWESA